MSKICCLPHLHRVEMWAFYGICQYFSTWKNTFMATFPITNAIYWTMPVNFNINSFVYSFDHVQFGLVHVTWPAINTIKLEQLKIKIKRCDETCQLCQYSFSLFLELINVAHLNHFYSWFKMSSQSKKNHAAVRLLTL